MEDFYIVKQHITDTSVSELDLELRDEFVVDDTIDMVKIEIGHGISDGYPIKIISIVDILIEMVKHGATHVGLNYHEDHIGYEISGYKLEAATSSQIEVYQKSVEEYKLKREKLNELKKQIKEIERGQL